MSRSGILLHGCHIEKFGRYSRINCQWTRSGSHRTMSDSEELITRCREAEERLAEVEARLIIKEADLRELHKEVGKLPN